MTNRVTKAERERINTRARQLVKMDTEYRVIGRADIEAQIAREFGISSARAKTAVAHAAMRKRASLVKWRKRRKPRGRTRRVE